MNQGRVALAGWVAAYDIDFSRPWSPQRLPTREHRILGGKQGNKHICGMSLLCRKYLREPFQASILHFTTFPVSNMSGTRFEERELQFFREWAIGKYETNSIRKSC
jgi:hypothetical protein